MVLVIRRDLRKDERGVASTVGTIMALLVFLTFLSLIVNQYVPVWMKDSEAAHLDTAVGQFADLKGAIDFQVLGAIMAQTAKQFFVPNPTATSVTLGVDGVPIFSSPSTGTLRANPDAGPWTVQFAYCIFVNNVCTNTNVWQNASGQVALSVANRYYPTGDVAYENGAVIRAQPDGQVIRAAPIFAVSPSSTNLSVAFELVNLYGSGSIAGTSTEIVSSKVFAVNEQTYTRLTSDLSITHQSAYGLAWFRFFNTTLATGLNVAATTYSVSAQTTTVTGKLTATSPPIYTISMFARPDLNLYTLTVTISASQLSLAFTLEQSFVNVDVGQNANLG